MAADASQHSSSPSEVWESNPDNEFASHLFTLIDWDRVVADIGHEVTGLCQHCASFGSARLFDPQWDLSKLQSNARTTSCPLCSLLLEVLDRHGIKRPGTVTLRQGRGILGVENGPDLLSIYAPPGMFQFVLQCRVSLTSSQVQPSQTEHSWGCHCSRRGRVTTIISS